MANHGISHIAPFMADVFMNYIIDQAMEKPPTEFRPELIFRYVHDLFLIFPSNSSAEMFYSNMNSVHASISFTKELAILHILTCSLNVQTPGVRAAERNFGPLCWTKC